MGTAGAGTDLDGDEATVVERSGCEARVSGVAALAQGDLLGRYVIIDRLGEGAMGVVFRAYDPKLRREVALKLLRDASAGKSIRARLLREAQALATLSHPNVVALYDAELTEHGVCLAMEYVQGSTLRAWLRARPRRWEEVSKVVLAAARGLAAAHARGLVHRDVKPDNVLVGSDGRVRITDFGLVRALDETRQDAESSDPIADDTATAHGVVLGSPAYMAPEQHAGKHVDARADQYGLCVMLWEALHGSRPFAGKDLEALARAKQGGPPAPPSRRVPRWLHALMAKGLAVVPEQRWTSVDALVDALAHGRARARRRRVGVALGLVGSTLVGAAAWQQIDRSRRVVACERAGAEIDEVWNARVATQVHDALLDTGLAYAEATYEKLVPWVDRWTRAWSEVRTQVCSDASVEHTLSPDLHASAVDCLDERREALVGLLDALARPDAATVQRAVPAAAGLAAPDRCVRRELLERRPPPPGPESAQSVLAARRELMRVSGFATSGRFAEALEQAETLHATARTLGYPPLIVQARLQAGTLALRAAKTERAHELLVDAYVEAGRIGLDELAADAASWLVYVVGTTAARHREALSWADAAELLVRRLGEADELRGGLLWNHLATLHRVRGAHAEAQTAAERALEIHERLLGPKHPEVAQSLNTLATTHFAQGRHATTKVLQERALAIFEETLGPQHPLVAQVLNNLAGLHFTLGELDEAKVLFERTISIDEATLGAEHPDIANAVHNLGIVHQARGDHDQARAMFERAIAIRERGLGPDHPLLASSINGLAGVDFALGDLDAAAERYERARTIYERALGPDHADVSQALQNLGAVALMRGELDEAEPLLERARDIRERTLGPRHPELVPTLVNLGDLHRARGDHAQSETMFERALEIASSAHGPGHPSRVRPLVGLGSIAEDRGALDRAEASHREALEILEKSYGSEHPELVHPMLGLGRVALSRGRPAEAIVVLERALEVYGDQHPPPAETWFALARALWVAPPEDGGDRQRALALARQAAELWRAAGPRRAHQLAELEAWSRTRR